MKKIVLIRDYKSTATIFKDDIHYKQSDYNSVNIFFEDETKVVYKPFHIMGEARTVKSACRWIGIPDYTLYANKRRTGELRTKKYVLEMLNVPNEEFNQVWWEKYEMEDNSIHK